MTRISLEHIWASHVQTTDPKKSVFLVKNRKQLRALILDVYKAPDVTETHNTNSHRIVFKKTFINVVGKVAKTGAPSKKIILIYSSHQDLIVTAYPV